MSDLTLPGTIPGLLRRGSPGFLIGDSVQRHLRNRAVTVHAVRGRMMSIAVDGVDMLVIADLDNAVLDLTDATGRAHAVWWLAANTVPNIGKHVTGAGWSSEFHSPRRGPAWRLTAFTTGGGSDESVFGALDGWVVVPALADLDPSDPRLLPDGSRWVDAEALRRAVLHVAGVRHD